MRRQYLFMKDQKCSNSMSFRGCSGGKIIDLIIFKQLYQKYSIAHIKEGKLLLYHLEKKQLGKAAC